MNERQSVIKGLTEISEFMRAKADIAGVGRGREVFDCLYRVAEDAIALLREQEPMRPVIRTARTSLLFEGDCEVSVAYCGHCGLALEQPTQDHAGWEYCPGCGKEITWNETD